MITDINQSSTIDKLNTANLPSYWSAYFDYEIDTVLYNLTYNKLKDAVELIRKQAKPFVDSQRVIGLILTELGSKHTFHRQFHERHGDSDSGQVLGMQLYHIMVDDSDLWTFCETKHKGHLFPHATYWIIK
jgi:hypothetical protein